MRDFDEFIGFDKEARVTENGLLHQVENIPELDYLYARALEGDSEANKAFNQKFHDFAIAQRMKEVEDHYNKKSKIKGPLNNMRALKAFEKSHPELAAKLSKDADRDSEFNNKYNAAQRDFMMDWERNRLDKKWRKRHLGKYAYDEICGFEKEAFRLGGFDGPRLKVPESNLSSISSTLKNHGGKLSAAQEAKKLEKLKELESVYKGLTNENFKNLKPKSTGDELAELAKSFGRR